MLRCDGRNEVPVKNSAPLERGWGDGVQGVVIVLAHVIDVEPYSLRKDVGAT